MITHHDELIVYECDGFLIEKNVPDLVVFPTSTEEVAAIVKTCSRLEFRSFLEARGPDWPGGPCPSVAA